jgi:hypothetical protein
MNDGTNRKDTMSRRTTVAVLAILAGSAFGGCSSGRHSGSAAPLSPSDLATRIGCTDYTATVPPTLFAREEGGCTLGDDDLDIVTFSSQATENNWLSAANSFGSGIIVKGNLWAVITGSQANADAVKAKTGGTT